MHYRNKSIYLFFTFLCVYFSSFSQKYNFKNYSVKDGLGQSQVHVCFQDSKGNMWFGTNGGVSKYDGKSFSTISTNEGLSHDVVWDIIEDRAGNIWISTLANGVTMYDGKKFAYFTDKELHNNSVWKIMEDKKGNLWFITIGGGVTKYNIYSDNEANRKFTHFSDKDGLNGMLVRDIIEDNQGKLWFALENGGINVYDGTTITDFIFNDSLFNKDVRALFQDRNNNILIGTHGYGLFKFDGYSITPMSYRKEEITLLNISDITEDKQGNIWITTIGTGLFKYNGRNFTNYTEKNGLSNNTIYSIIEDREGNLWLGTNGAGVDMFSGEVFTQYTTNEGLSSNLVWSILKDKNDNLWIGTYGGGLNFFDGQQFTNVFQKFGLKNKEFLSGIQDDNGNLWFGSLNGGIYKYDYKEFKNYSTKDGLSNNLVSHILCDTAGILWIGTLGGGFNKFDTKYSGDIQKAFTHYNQKNGLTSNAIYTLHKSNNILWIGTDENGVCLFDGSSFVAITEQHGLSKNIINTIYEDTRGNIWFGTYGGGISILCKSSVLSLIKSCSSINVNNKDNSNVINVKQQLKWKHITHKEGLSDNIVVGIYSDKTGNIWVATNRGINKLVTGDLNNTSSALLIEDNFGIKSIKRFGSAEGFKALECNPNGFCEDKNGILWFGTIEGIFKYSPHEDKTNLAEPKAHITGLKLFFEPINWASEIADTASLNNNNNNNASIRGDKQSATSTIKYEGVTKWYQMPVNLVLPYDKNHLTFEFIGISFKIPEKTRYRWKMQGFDKDWSPVSDKTEATYSNLPPGKYTFKVIACNDEGIWNKQPATYSFEITRPFWNTWWFYAICILAIMLFIATYIKIRLRNLQRTKRILEEQVKLRTQQLIIEKEKVTLQKETIALEKGKLENTNKALTNAYHNLKKLEYFKETMMEMIVHDLKNPINTIINFSMNKPVQNTMDTIHQAGNLMLNMVLNILDIHKYEEASIKLEKSNFPVSLVVHDAIRQIKILIKQKNLTVNNVVDHSLYSNFDFEIISRVLVNLLTNAIKYSNTGGSITVDAATWTEKDKEYIKMSVSDTGSGITKDKIDKLFKKYVQINAARSGDVKSTGLGLVFCKIMIESHGGKIWVESELSKGTTFFFTLPLQAVEQSSIQNKILITNKPELISSSLVAENLNVLTENDKKMLSSIYLQFAESDVYETSKNLGILKQIDIKDDNGILSWKTEMEAVIYNRDEAKYKKLLALIKDQ